MPVSTPTPRAPEATFTNGAVRIAVVYAVAASLYIVVSDQLVVLLFHDIETISLVSTLKGWGFVLITSVLLWVMIRRHIADLLASEAARLEREALVSTIVDSAGGYLYVKDLDYRYQFVNAAVCELFGVDAAAMVGSDDSRFLDEATVAAIRANDRRVIEQGERVEAEEVHASAGGGGTRTYLSVKMPLRNAEGTTIGLCGFSTDISELKAAEHERMRLRDQLLQAQKMEVVGQLTGGIAHDFNNILTSILGHASLLQDLETVANDPTLKDYVEAIEVAGERASDLVKNMLRFSRGHVSTGEAHTVRAEPIVAEAVKMLTATIPSSIQIRTEFDERAASIRLDPVELHQVITNLVINARDALGGVGSIGIALANRSRTRDTCTACHAVVDGEFVELSVTDTGSGIAPNHLSAIFEPFFTTKDVGKGTGLGLAVVHGIVHKAGGHIEVDSTVGLGTTISLLFPGVAPDTARTDSGVAALPAPATLVRSRVMVVDDEPVLTRLLRTVLESRGIHVTTYNDSEAALDAFAAAPDEVDLVVTDQTMPRMTGDELARRMLAIRSTLPVLLCTGYSDRIDGPTAAALGIRRFMTKPIAMADLVRAVIDELPPAGAGK